MRNSTIRLCFISLRRRCIGKAYRGYNGDDIKYKMSGLDVMKMLYAIHIGDENALPIINVHCFDNIEGLKRLRFLSSDEQGKVICDVPVIKMDDCPKLYELSEKYDNMIFKKFHDEIMKLMQNPVKQPSHLKSVPTGRDI